MPSQKNLDQVNAIKTNLEKSQSFIIADYSGLNSADQTALRAKTKAAGGEFTVTKNRLISIVLKQRLTNLPETLKKALQGPNAVVFGYTDSVAATKAVVEFAKDHDNLKIKIGLLVGQEGNQDQILSADQIKSLAALPGKPELLAQLVGQLNAPLYGLVNVLSGNTRKLVYVLAAIKDKKSIN